MGDLNFNTKQCTRALKKLGFCLQRKRFGKHDKFFPPEYIAAKLAADQPHFIMIPRHKKLHCQPEIFRELRKMGGDQLLEKFKKEIKGVRSC